MVGIGGGAPCHRASIFPAFNSAAKAAGVAHLITFKQADPDRYMTPDAVLVLEIGNERPNFERAFPDLAVTWLDTTSGADQLLLITRDALLLESESA